MTTEAVFSGEAANKVVVTFSGEAAKDVKDLANKLKQSVEDMIADAVVTKAWVDNLAKEGKLYIRENTNRGILRQITYHPVNDDASGQ